MALNYVQISGEFLDSQDNPLTGTVTITANTTVYASGIPVLSPDVPVQAEIVAGALKNLSGGTLQLLATDNSGLSFVGQTGFLFYTVTTVIGGETLDPWSFFLPFSTLGAGPVDLYSLANTPAGGGGGGGSGTVTSVSVVSANGLAGTVASPSTTPAITLRTTVTGVLKGNGTTISAAVSGTDYAPATSGSAILKGNGSGGFASAASGTDYAPATSGTSILKGSGSGGFSAAVAGTDYLAPSGSGAALTGITPAQVGAVSATSGGGEGLVALGNITGAVTVSLASGNVVTGTLTGNVTFTFPTVSASTGNSFSLYLTQDATGGRLVTWPGSVTWLGTGAPVLPTAAASVSLLVFETVNGGTTWYGSAVQQLPSLPLSIPNGGTGQATAAAAYNALSPMTTLGDIEYESGASTAARLAGNTTTTRQFLRQQGTGSASAAPAWDTLQAGDIPQLADYAPTGLTGATAVSRYVGATTSGAPASGTFQVGDFVADRTGKFWLCTTAGSPGTWTQIGGGGGSANYAGIFGDGSDGSVTLDGSTSYSGFSSLGGSTYTLTRDVFATSLTINSGVTLQNNSYRVFCTGTFTNSSGGTVSNPGGDSAGAGGGTGATRGGSYGGGAAGASGTTGAGTNGPSSSGLTAGTGGSGFGGTGSSGSGGNQNGSWLSSPYPWRIPSTALSGALSVSDSGHSTNLSGGNGGASGGGDGTNSGGGGGGGGGICVIFAHSASNAGTIDMHGGAGHTPGAGNCGGGGGGAGGVIIVYTLSAWSNTGTTNVAGGAAGSGSGTGTAGGAGTSGSVLNVVVQ